MEFNRCFIYFSTIFLLLLILPFFSTNAIICNENYACIAASNFSIYMPVSAETLKQKECDDGCADFFCVVENKTKVIFGAGCYSDYEKACKDAPPEAKIDIKSLNATPRIIKTIGHFLDVCNLDLCSEFDFNDAIFDNLYFLNTTFLDGIDQSYTEKCEYPETLQSSTVKHSSTIKPGEDLTTNGELMNQMNGFVKLFGMILSGYVLAKVW